MANQQNQQNSIVGWIVVLLLGAFILNHLGWINLEKIQNQSTQQVDLVNNNTHPVGNSQQTPDFVVQPNITVNCPTICNTQKPKQKKRARKRKPAVRQLQCATFSYDANGSKYCVDNAVQSSYSHQSTASHSHQQTNNTQQPAPRNEYTLWEMEDVNPDQTNAQLVRTQIVARSNEKIAWTGVVKQGVKSLGNIAVAETIGNYYEKGQGARRPDTSTTTVEGGTVNVDTDVDVDTNTDIDTDIRDENNGGTSDPDDGGTDNGTRDENNGGTSADSDGGNSGDDGSHDTGGDRGEADGGSSGGQG